MNRGDVSDNTGAAFRSSLRSYRTVQVYITFAELGIGDALDSRPLTLDELASACECDPAALGRFLAAAEALGMIESDVNGRFSSTELTRRALTSTSQSSFVDLLVLESAFYRRWACLPGAIRSGKRPDISREQEREPGWVRRFTRALYVGSRSIASGVAQALEQMIPGLVPTRLIDIGGGHGGYSIAIARRYPAVAAIVFDLPPVIEVAREIITEAGMTERVTTVAGDFHVDPLGSDVDIALLFGVLHGERPENIPPLLSKVRDALRPDGTLLIRSQGRSDIPADPAERALTDLHMLLSTDEGSARSAFDTEALLRDAGFILDRPLEIPDPGSGQLIVARRRN
jgi:SAM-dependent methyltransferase